MARDAETVRIPRSRSPEPGPAKSSGSCMQRRLPHMARKNLSTALQGARGNAHDGWRRLRTEVEPSAKAVGGVGLAGCSQRSL